MLLALLNPEGKYKLSWLTCKQIYIHENCKKSIKLTIKWTYHVKSTHYSLHYVCSTPMYPVTD